MRKRRAAGEPISSPCLPYDLCKISWFSVCMEWVGELNMDVWYGMWGGMTCFCEFEPSVALFPLFPLLLSKFRQKSQQQQSAELKMKNQN